MNILDIRGFFILQIKSEYPLRTACTLLTKKKR